MYNKIVGLIGPTGSGKSYTAAQMMAATKCCAVFQLKRIHEEPAFAMSADDIVDGDIRTLALKFCEEQFRLVYLCQPPDTEGKRLVSKDFDLFIQACYIRENMCMIVDEAHFFCDPWHIPVFFRQAVVMGRSRYLDIIYCAQKFSTISKELTANSHELYLWRIAEPGDLASIGERCGADVAEAVANLRASQDLRRDGGEFIPGEYLHWKNTGEWKVIDPCLLKFSSSLRSEQDLSPPSSSPSESLESEPTSESTDEIQDSTSPENTPSSRASQEN